MLLLTEPSLSQNVRTLLLLSQNVSVKKRRIFSDYLESVVFLAKDNYKNIRALMERCQALGGAK